MVVSVEVGLRKMLMLRQVGLLVIESSRKLTFLLDSMAGLSWMLLWIVSMYCRMIPHAPTQITFCKKINKEILGKFSTVMKQACFERKCPTVLIFTTVLNRR